MRMKTRTALVVAAVATTGALGVGGGAQAATSAKVTIKGNNGDYYGYVKSSKSSCENGRKVKVYKLKGSKPKPKNDKLIGSDIAQPNGPHSMWSIGNSGYKHGEFYARATPTKKCSKAVSKVISR